jgi:hypothetical protein
MQSGTDKVEGGQACQWHDTIILQLAVSSELVWATLEMHKTALSFLHLEQVSRPSDYSWVSD